VLGAVFSDIMAQVGVFYYLFRQVQRREDIPVKGNLKGKKTQLLLEIWKYGRWNYFILFFNFYIGELPIMILSYFFPYNIVGFYSIGRGLMEKTRILPSAFSQALFPYTAASEEAVAVNRTNILCRNFVVLSCAMVTVLSVVIKPVIILLYGEAFLPVVPVFYAIIPAIILWPLSQFLAVHVAGFGDPKKVLLRSLFALPGCIAACIIFIPAWGAVGAALSVSVVYLILAAVSLYIYKKTTGVQLSEILIIGAEDVVFYKGIVNKLPMRLFKSQSTKR
jgi:O-antigen/teichoic acid export membrane protein